jgi:hypothetical protein
MSDVMMDPSFSSLRSKWISEMDMGQKSDEQDGRIVGLRV